MQKIQYYAFRALDWFGLKSSYIFNDPGAKVIEGVYIGSLSTVTNENHLRDMNIGAIVNLSGSNYASNHTSNHTNECSNSYLNSIPRLDLSINDAQITLQNMESYIKIFSRGTDYITLARKENKCVLVHCAAGVNRSAALIAFYLIQCGWSYQQSIDMITQANETRSAPALTNNSFRYLLQAHDSFQRNFTQPQT